MNLLQRLQHFLLSLRRHFAPAPSSLNRKPLPEDSPTTQTKADKASDVDRNSKEVNRLKQAFEDNRQKVDAEYTQRPNKSEYLRPAQYDTRHALQSQNTHLQEEREVRREVNRRQNTLDTLDRDKPPVEKRSIETQSEHTRLEQEQDPSQTKFGESTIDIKGIHPLLRGGGHWKNAQDQIRSRPESNQTRKGRSVEVVCLYDGLDWQLGLQVNDNQQSDNIRISGSVAKWRDDSDKHWRIQDFYAPIKVTCEGETYTALPETPPRLLFKVNDDLSQGTLTHVVRSGMYLVVYPSGDGIEDAQEDTAAPVNLDLDGYQAYLILGEDAKALRTIFGDQVASALDNIVIHFDGPRLQDNSDDVDLYSEPPLLRAERAQDWQQVRLIVVGDDDNLYRDMGRPEWRKDWVPKQGHQEQQLPLRLYERKGGKYYVRYYGIHEGMWQLLYSHGFRFQSGLHDVRIEQPETLYEPTRVTFCHRPECLIDIDQGSDPAVCVEHAAERPEDGLKLITYALVPRPTRTSFLFHIRDKGRSDTSYGSVYVHTQGLWWALSTDEEPPTESAWSQDVLPLCSEQMAPTSHHALWLKFSHPRLTSRIAIGFEGYAATQIPIKVTETQVSVPLRNFTDAQGAGVLRLWPFDDSLMCYSVAKIGTRLPDGSEIL